MVRVSVHMIRIGVSIHMVRVTVNVHVVKVFVCSGLSQKRWERIAVVVLQVRRRPQEELWQWR